MGTRFLLREAVAFGMDLWVRPLPWPSLRPTLFSSFPSACRRYKGCALGWTVQPLVVLLRVIAIFDSRPREIMSATHVPLVRRRIKRCETQNLRVCTLRFATNRAVFDFPLPDGVLSNHYRGVFETDRGPYQQDRSAPLARSEPNKPSSSFDLAIDNKDFEYGNQGRG
ncbi:GL17266 [Drosophila persimilis]|uniref:GL17266 n=1 Tax=Drosophila persimilis TaxID=7234 RepID=B4GIT7_DROPE|nr:GL17266 [Drosophila persimilis]